MYYDKETEQKLFNLSKRVADEKLSTKFLEWKTRPHLTLACFNDVDEEKCIKQLKEFVQSHKRMPAYIGSVGMFNDTKTIFVSPVMNSSMYQFQRELHEYLNDFDSSEVGCNTVLNPGTILGKGSIVYPLCSVRGYIPENSILKNSGEIVERK